MWSSELPYHSDSAALFEAVADSPWAVFLDSSHRHPRWGRYDVLGISPATTLVSRGGVTRIEGRGGVRECSGNPLELLRRELRGFEGGSLGDLPFCGGALGYLGYDLLRGAREGGGGKPADGLPTMAVGIYEWVLVVDHVRRRSWLVGDRRGALSAPEREALAERFSRPAQPAPRTPLRLLTPVRSNLTRAQYDAAFARIKRYLREGDCYQVNFAQRFEAAVAGDPWLAYRTLRRANPAPFGAYFNTPWGQILSLSPERFLKIADGAVESRPIKGTRPRAADPGRDAALRRELAGSVKDRAENLMIVDLLRNDLGKSCRPGSVRVPHLFAVESYATVHHLVSTVSGELAAGRDALHLLEGAFPGGSITGAPKRRAMEVIDELEPHPRGVYCGSIGYWGFDGGMDTNIAIRTLVHHQGQVRFWAGGGIVHDSQADAEYEETFAKAAAILRLLGDPGRG